MDSEMGNIKQGLFGYLVIWLSAPGQKHANVPGNWLLVNLAYKVT